MATMTERERRLSRQLREANKKGPIQQRLERVVQTGLVPYTAAIGLGYTAERFGEAKGAVAILGATVLGLAGQALINPSPNSVTDVVLSGLAGAGVSVMGLEHGRVAGRLHMAKMATSEQAAEEQRKAEALEADTRDTEIVTDDERQAVNAGG